MRHTVAAAWLPVPASSPGSRWRETSAAIDDLRAGLADADHARFVVRDLDASRHSAVTAAIGARLAFFTAKLAALDAPVVDVRPMLDRDWVIDRWQAAGVVERRMLLRASLQSVSLAKATRRGGQFDPARLEAVWRSPAELAEAGLVSIGQPPI